MDLTLNKVRIIGGKWRGRKIQFPAVDQLRPTHDRIRETLFNWLSPHIVGAICLDLFAGSGVIGFEAISRGAEQVVMLDENQEVITALRRNQVKLAAEDVQIIQTKIPDTKIKLPYQQFDIIFLDPPYFQHLIQPTLSWLLTKCYVKTGTLIFIEMEKGHEAFNLPAELVILKQKQTATISYYLLEVIAHSLAL